MSAAAPAPTVSVVMAAYNGAPWIGETLASVFAQTMPDFEIVVVDDCSRDETLAVLDAIPDPRLRVIRSPTNGGPAVARTLAMANARGRYIAGLDQDDLCDPTRFARQIAFLDCHPGMALVTSTIRTFGDGTERADSYPDLIDPEAIDWTMLLLNPLAWSTAMMRGEAARALIPFERDEYRFAEDFDLYHRIRARGRIGRMAAPLVQYRLHPGGASATYEEGMIRSAGAVLADRYGTLFGGREQAAGLLMSRHAGAGHPPADIATLEACGRVLGRLLAACGDVAPGFAAESASAHWWRIARAGLRRGSYPIGALRGARPDFARDGHAGGGRLSRDGMVGAARRLVQRYAV